MAKNVKFLDWAAELGDKDYDTIDNEFTLLRNPIIKKIDHPFKIDVCIAMVCAKGSVSGRVNLKEYVAETPSLSIVFPGQILEFNYFTEDFEGYFMIMGKRFTDELLPAQERFPLSVYFKDNPYIPLNDETLGALLTYYNLIQKTICMKDNPHRLKAVSYLTKAFFYGGGYRFPVLENKRKTKHEILVEHFMDLLQAHFKEEREVGFYAGKLCLTPKYLSRVIKENSGKSVNEWIDEHVILEAKALLKSTNMTIQQICDDLNFPDQSFFGKYFKRLMGESPKAYRNR